MNGMQRIEAERKRQVEVEGWSQAHDAQHFNGALTRAASCYELAGDLISGGAKPDRTPPIEWPWEVHWWKPASTAERNYEKAGALYKAEADRIRHQFPGRADADVLDVEVERVAAKLDRPTGTAPFVKPVQTKDEK